MSREIPEPIRAAAGLAATVVDEARKLPETLPGLPVRVIGLAMQTALRVQQQWAGLVARGDELLTGLRGEDEPGLATFDDDLDAPPARSSARASAFDRATVEDDDHDEDPDLAVEDPDLAVGDPDLAVGDTAAALDETDAVAGADASTGALLVDDEVSGLAAASDPAEVVETLQDITDQVAALDEAAAAEDAEAVLTPEDALESALLETDGAPDVPGIASTDPETSTDTDTDEVTEVDVLTPDGEVATVEATVTDEAIAAPESPTGDAIGTADEGATGTATSGAPIDGYEAWTVAQLRGRLRGYQLATVADLLAYEESSRNRQPFVSMLRNRLEKLERQAVDASPLTPRGM
jgi:hypothetical protein